MTISWEHGEMDALRAQLDSSAKIDAEVAQVVRKNGDLLRQNVSSRSPVDTGELRDSWKVKASGGSGGMTAEVESTVRQSFFQEYGTSKMAAQPSAGPGLEATAPSFVADMERVAEKFLD